MILIYIAYAMATFGCVMGIYHEAKMDPDVTKTFWFQKDDDVPMWIILVTVAIFWPALFVYTGSRYNWNRQ